MFYLRGSQLAAGLSYFYTANFCIGWTMVEVLILIYLKQYMFDFSDEAYRVSVLLREYGSTAVVSSS